MDGMLDTRHFDGASVSRSDWPIIVTDFSARPISDEAHREMLGYLEELMREAVGRREKVFIITDLTRMREFASARRRQDTSEWLKRTADLSRAASVGSGHVTPSSVLRGLITAVFWLVPPPTPSFCVSTRREAMLKGIQLLESAKIPVPFRLLALRDGAGAPSPE
jgi:hypothetical protein